MPESDWSWCGSNYDALGNARFIDQPVDTHKDPATLISDFNYGYTNFDNFGDAFITIYQVITGEGWSAIMYYCQDSIGYYYSSIYFLSIIIIGMFVVLQLILAILEENFNATSNITKVRTMSEPQLNAAAVPHLVVNTAIRNSNKNDDEDDDDDNRIKFNNEDNPRPYSLLSTDSKDEYTYLTLYTKMKYVVSKFVSSDLFEWISIVIVAVNTIILMMDSYPVNINKANNLQIINEILVILFVLEMILKNLVLGLKQYWTDTFNFFDGIVNFISLVEFFISTPVIFGGNLLGIVLFNYLIYLFISFLIN